MSTSRTERTNDRPTGGNWLEAFRLIWRVSPLHVVSIAVLTVATGVLPAVNVWLVSEAVQAVSDAVAGDPAGMDRAWRVAGGLAASAAVAHVAGIAKNYVESMLQSLASNAINERLMQKSIELSLAQFENSAVYDQLQLAKQEASFRPYQIFSDLISTLSQAVTLVSVAAVLVSWSPWVALVVLLAPLPSMMAELFFSRIVWQVEKDRSADRRRIGYLQYLVTNDRTFKETRLFDLGPLFVSRFRELVDRFYRVDRSIERRQSTASGSLGLLTVLAAAGATILSMYVTVGNGEIGQFAGFLTSLAVVQTSVTMLLGGVAQLYEHTLFLGNLFSFLALPVRPPSSGVRALPAPLRRGVEFRDVHFTYPGTDEPVLRGLSMFLPAGQSVAMVGRNGVGKTTIVKLLAGFYRPDRGEILIDGVPVEDYDLDELRAGVGVIFQDFVQYEASVRDNIGFGRMAHHGDDDRVHGAASRAGASEFLDPLAHGLDTQLGRWFEDGHQLSGGQWQRVALARAFLRDAPILVLDEPTAAIDAAAEAQLFERLATIADDATTLLIAHRFSTVRVADRIVVVESGQVIESGSHHELLDLDGTYATLFRLQAQGYQLDDVPTHP